MYNKHEIMKNAWNRKRTEKIGYVDNLTGKFGASDKSCGIHMNRQM